MRDRARLRTPTPMQAERNRKVRLKAKSTANVSSPVAPTPVSNAECQGEPNRKFPFVSLRNGHIPGYIVAAKAAENCDVGRSLAACDQLAQTCSANIAAITRAAGSSGQPTPAGRR